MARKTNSLAIRIFVSLVAAVFMSSSAAFADKWVVDDTKSAITFHISVAGQKVEGRVQSFKADIAFTPDKPDATAILASFDMASLTVGNPDGDAALKEKEWFDVSTHPNGSFEARTFKTLEDGQYELSGSLTLRGVTKPVALPFSLKINGDAAEAAGSVTLNRNDFEIGTNADTGPISVGDDVVVTLKIVAKKG